MERGLEFLLVARDPSGFPLRLLLHALAGVERAWAVARKMPSVSALEAKALAASPLVLVRSEPRARRVDSSRGCSGVETRRGCRAR